MKKRGGMNAVNRLAAARGRGHSCPRVDARIVCKGENSRYAAEPEALALPRGQVPRPLADIPSCPPSISFDLRPSTRRHGAKHAFSLVELIVALAITTAMAGVMITIVVNLLDGAQRATGTLMSNNQAKVALDFLAQDLQSVVMRPDENVWLAATVQPDQIGAGDSGAGMALWNPTAGGTTKPGNANAGAAVSSLQLDPDVGGASTERLEDYRFGMAGVWLRFFTTEPDSNDDREQLSVPRAVSYQIVRYRISTDADASLRYGLFKSSVRPFDVDGNDSTFGVGYDIFDLAYNNGGGFAGDPGTIRTPQRNFLLANNVIDFGVRFWTTDENGLVLLFPLANTDRGFAATVADGDPVPAAVPPVPDPGIAMLYGFPEVADIFLRVLSDDGGKVLEAYERNPAPDVTWWEVALANSRVYTRRINIKGGVP